jgi:hypothetical protein
MAKDEMFDSAMRPVGDRAGVFEYDGETAYFYLYETKGSDCLKVIAAIRVLVGTPDFEEEDVSIRWDDSESKVGLFIRGQLWAAFDAQDNGKYGGNYRPNVEAGIPSKMSAAFEP